MSKDYTQISKEVSYALRHKPEEYSLKLDAEGWTDADALVSAINAKSHRNITLADIEHIIETSEKKRFEIAGSKIRACYGHSFSGKVAYKEQTPPPVLYHGTTHAALGSILRDGLLPMGRQYVHMSADTSTAVRVGKRRDSHPVVLTVDARAMSVAGCKFYLGNDSTWLTDKVAPEYIVAQVDR